MSEQQPSRPAVKPVPPAPGRSFPIRPMRRASRWPPRCRTREVMRAEPVPGSAEVESPKLVPEQAAAGEGPRANPPKAMLPRPRLRPKSQGRCRQSRRAAHARQGHDHVLRRSRLGSMTTPVRRRNPSRARACSASAGLRALAAVVALAAMAGALGGAMATASLQHFAGDDAATARQPRARSLGGADRCRHPGAEGQRRAHLQDRHDPVQQDQRAPRQGREGAGRTRRQTRQAQRGRRKASRHAAGAGAGRRRAGCAAKEVTGSISPPPRPRAALRTKVEVAQAADGGRLDRCATSPMAAP